MVDRRSLRSGGSAFASFRCYVWIGICFAVVDQHLGRSLIGVWFADRRLVRRCDRRLDRSLSLSLAECVLFAWVFSFCGSFSLLRVLRKMFEGKNNYVK